MPALDLLIPAPRLLEIDHVDLDAPPARVWQRVRHADLATSPLIRALFALRALPGRIAGKPPEPTSVRIDDLVSSVAKPGFQILIDNPPRELAVGAIGRVWEGEIPFVHVQGADEYAAFETAGYAKVAWAVRVLPRGERGCRFEIEVRVDTTDEASWTRFRRYFRWIGMGSRFIRHSLLSSLAHEFGALDAGEGERPLEGDDLLPEAQATHTRAIDIAAPPDAIWPWLLQMGRGRAGFYSFDAIDNGGVRSATELHPELAGIAVGDVLPATPDGEDGFEVLRIDPSRALILGGLFDATVGRQVPFSSLPVPARFWQVTWAFVLERIDERMTRLHVRARARFSTSARLHAAWIRPVHGLMEWAQLRHLAARAEGRLPADGWRDVVEGVGGAALMTIALLTPFLRSSRNHWGLDAKGAALPRPGDDLVPDPRWSWTHAIAIDAPADAVWPWVAQIGAGRAGFYSYQWLENLAGCELRNAERVHQEWQLREGDEVRMHPKAPPLRVARIVPGRWLVAHGPADEAARAAGRPWAAASWLLSVEQLDAHRCRVISRFRSACSDDLATRLAMGPALLEPVGFAMDRKMLLGIKARVEKALRTLRHLERVADQEPVR